MAQQCDVCRNFKPEQAVSGPVEDVKFGERSVALCRGHARIAANAGVRTFAALRKLFGSGRRSYVSRRRRELTVEFEQRVSRGRRASDRLALPQR
jgi:hypothetical protein